MDRNNIFSVETVRLVQWFDKGSWFHLNENIHFPVIIAVLPLVEWSWVDNRESHLLGQDQGTWTFLSGWLRCEGWCETQAWGSG